MNEKQKDKGLMKAVKEQPQFRLTSNFTFRTMQKVEEAILLREKKQERKMIFQEWCLKYCFFIHRSKIMNKGIVMMNSR